MDIKNLNTRKKLQVAEDFYKETLKKNPDDVEAHNNLGVILFQLGKLQEAKSSYQKAIQINPKYLNAHKNLAAVFKLLGELQKALGSL